MRAAGSSRRYAVPAVIATALALGFAVAGPASAGPAPTLGTGAASTVGTASAPALGQVSATPSRGPGTFVPLTPARLVDTRNGNGAGGPVAARATVHLQVGGRGGVPTTGVSAAVLNVTVTQPTRAGYITAYPDGVARPTASNLNYVAGQTVANLVTVKVGANGKVALYNGSSGTVQLVADVSGYYVGGTPTDTGTFVAVAPARVLDTRTGNGASGPVPPHGTVHLQVFGAGGVPATGVWTVVLNVTVTEPTRSGYITVYPDGYARPTASSLNFVSGQTVPNVVTAVVFTGGVVDLYNGSSGTVQLVADVAGYYLEGNGWASAPPMGTFVALPPNRLVDTRTDMGASGPVAARGTVHVPVSALNQWQGLSDVAAVVLNVTVTAPTRAGYITAYPDGTPRPTASNLNFAPGQTVPNMVVVGPGTNGTAGDVDLYNGSSGTVQLVVDVAGYFLFNNPTPSVDAPVAVGSAHSCAMTSDGGLKCWGDNSLGQLGDLYGQEHQGPVETVSSGVVSVASGGFTSCAVTLTGSNVGAAVCWGDNSDGQLGDGKTTSRPYPWRVSGPGYPSPVAIAVGDRFACKLDAAGGVQCWGRNADGQLGNGTTASSTTPVPISALTRGVVAIAAGDDHACALTATGTVRCWGDNSRGQLGTGTTTSSTTPVQVTGLTAGVTALSAGHAHSCAVTAAGAAVCWGDNDSGEVGDGNPSNDAVAPTQVAGLTSGVADVTAGGEHTCALTVGGGVQCWGDNGSGQLGTGTATQMQTTPVQVVGLAGGATAVATGPSHTCATLDSGGVSCWGSNWAGQLGNGENGQVTTPTQVSGLTSGVTAASAGQSACAVVDGALTCWGYGGHGELGVGTFADASTPTQVSGLTSGVTAVSSGIHTCAVTAGGAVNCWGANFSGELGDGTTDDHLTPVQVSGLTSGATGVATGGAFSCAITAAGAVECWGDNGVGQLGDGTTAASTTPVQVSGLTSGVQAIAAGLDFACALTSVGAVTCWGDNVTGQLGDGSTTTSPAPVQVTGLTSGVTAIGAGIRHACAVTSAGAAVCWGANWEDQLGTGVSGGSTTTPAQVVGLTSGVTAVSAGRAHTCAVVSGGLMCWGSGTSGQLGNGSSDGLQPFPVGVVGLTSGVTAVSAGDDNTCAIVSGALKCWGSRAYGAIGNGTSTIVPTPVSVVGF